MTVSQAAEALGLTRSSVYRYCRLGRLGRRVGSRYEISPVELRDFLLTPRKPGWPEGRPRRKAGREMMVK